MGLTQEYLFFFVPGNFPEGYSRVWCFFIKNKERRLGKLSSVQKNLQNGLMWMFDQKQ